MDGINEQHYLQTLGPEGLSQILTGQVSTFSGLGSFGKSGSFFYYTHDQKFMVKTIKKNEKKLLIEILKMYHVFLRENPKTFISKITGFHKMKMVKNGSKSVDKHYLIIMKNIFGDCKFKSEVQYDLKGSLHNRTTPDEKIAKGEPGKDKNWIQDKVKIHIEEMSTVQIMIQLRNDASFLKTCNINDYSLLIGIHKKEQDDPLSLVQREESPTKQTRGKDEPANTVSIQIPALEAETYGRRTKTSEESPKRFGSRTRTTEESPTRKRTLTSSSPQMTFLRVLSRADQWQKKNVKSKELGYKEYLSKNQYAFESTDGKLIYTFGIIDILTGYGMAKE